MLSISVIIPSRNRADLLPRAIDSILAQTCPVNEIIVVDDGSTDNTRELLRQRYPGVTLVQQPGRGVSSARNSGIKTATGDWLAFLDSDDAWLPHKIERQVQMLAANPGHLLIHCNERWIRNGREQKQLKKHRKYGGRIFTRCLPMCVISPSAVIINRQVFKTIGLFDESLPVCEDYDMWLRICSRLPVLFVDEPLLVKYGGHDGQLSAAQPAMDRYRIRALARIIDSNILDGADKEAAMNTLLEKIGIYMRGAKKYNNRQGLLECRRLLAVYGVN